MNDFVPVLHFDDKSSLLLVLDVDIARASCKESMNFAFLDEFIKLGKAIKITTANTKVAVIISMTENPI